jgi:methionyl-tRNA synthetase
MAHRYRQGRLAATAAPSDRLAGVAEQVVGAYSKAMDGFAIHEGAAAAFRLIDATNEFIAATAPWTLAKDPANADRLTQVLFDAAEAIRLAACCSSRSCPRRAARFCGASAHRPTASVSSGTAAGAATANAFSCRTAHCGRA